MSYFDGINNEDIICLTQIYLSILTEQECMFIFTSFDIVKKNIIPGTIPFAESFYYTYENIFDGTLKDEFLRIADGKMSHHKIFILCARQILETRNNGTPKNNPGNSKERV
jgi:hypothetical protein